MELVYDEIQNFFLKLIKHISAILLYKADCVFQQGKNYHADKFFYFCMRLSKKCHYLE